jgi:hypothetical protein
MGGRILGAAGSPAVLLLPALAIAWALPDGAHLPNHMIWPHPPRRNALVNHLERDIALRPGAPYRGSVATFTGYADLPNGIAWLDQHNYDSQLQTALGNDMRAIGLWRYDIPTLFEYNQLITPTFHLMITRKLARPGDQQVRNVVVLSKVDVDYLASIGVRFVIADNEEPLQQGAKLRESIELADGAAVRLFEIDRPNLGDYSPTQVILARDAAEAVSLLDDDFDYRRSVVLHAPWPDSLVAAGFSELRPERNGLRLKASSRATSLLLLPLQYSHCLDLDVVRGDAARVRLVRANLMQAAVVFSGDVELLLSFRYGPFANPYGRIADYLDVKRLKIAEVPLPRACPRETRTDGHHPSDENLSPSEIGNDAHQTARATPMASAEKPDLHAKH